MTLLRTKRPVPQLVLVTVLTGCSLSACGLTESGLVSGLAPELSGAELSPAEGEQLCQAVRRFAEQHPWDETAKCRAVSLASAPGRGTLEEERYMCRVNYEYCTPVGGPPVTFCDDFSEGEFLLPECTSSVQEIEQCLEIDIARSSEIVNGLRYCDEVDLDYITFAQKSLFREMRVPEGCRSVWQNCQQVLR